MMPRHSGWIVGLVVLLAVGCAGPKVRVLPNLPDPIVDIPSAKSPSRAASPARAATNAAASLETYAEPGWIPPGGISNRWQAIVIHHSANDQSSPQSMDRYHRQRNGWDELGYHFVIGNGLGYPDGQVYVGPRWLKQKHGAHCKTPDNFYNNHGIGICLIGNFERSWPTAAQMDALVRLVRFLMVRCDIPISRIYTHGGITGRTRCPGRHFHLDELKRRLRQAAHAR